LAPTVLIKSMETVMKKSFVSAAIAALALIQSCSPAIAQEGQSQTAAISMNGLDLSSKAGVQALDRRILAAASRLCGIPSPADPQGRTAYRKCRGEVKAQAASAREQAISVALHKVGVAVTASR